MISVIIPAGPNEKIKNINRTIDSLRTNAASTLEFIVLADGWVPKNVDKDAIVHSLKTNKGERETLNKGAELSTGSHILRIDAHCSMSKDWDVEFLKYCTDNTICISTLDALDEKTWTSKGHDYRFVYMTPSGEEKWWGGKKENALIDCEPTMSFTGCGWLCTRDFYLNFIKADVGLAKWGSIGPEMTLKVEKAGGSILLCKKVKCGHVFNTNAKGYPVSVVTDTRKKLLSSYHKELYNIAKRFSPVPSWENVNEDYLENWESYFMYNTDVTRQEKTEVKDSNGKVIKKIIKNYKPVKYKGKENPDIPEVGKRLTENANIDSIKVAELKEDGNWKFIQYNTKQEIDMYFFENE